MSPPATLLADLRDRIRHLERPTPRTGQILPFNLPKIDQHLPEGGLAYGALHEIVGGGADAVPAASAALFAAGILARLGPRPVLWCTTTADLFAPGLACAGLHPDRVLYAQAPDEKALLQVMEEALRYSGLAAVAGELFRLPMTASRRLALAAEKSGVMAITLRRRREGREVEEGPTAAATRWRITPLPSAALAFSEIGRARWEVALTRGRGTPAKTWIMEACDAQGYLAVSAELADRSAAAPGGLRVA